MMRKPRKRLKLMMWRLTRPNLDRRLVKNRRFIAPVLFPRRKILENPLDFRACCLTGGRSFGTLKVRKGNGLTRAGNVTRIGTIYKLPADR
jgi:hypothetical protein